MELEHLAAAFDKSVKRRKELEDEVAELRERIEELEQVVDTDPDQINYDQMTKQDKVRQLRSYLIEDAQTSPNKTASITYDNVQALFNGRPSPGHAYDLMDIAAQAEGFNYDEFEGDRKNRVTVNLQAANEEPAFRGANKANGDNPA